MTYFVPELSAATAFEAEPKKAPIVITAIARELVGFFWAIGQQVKLKAFNE
jgi:glucose uptake protein GlcU